MNVGIRRARRSPEPFPDNWADAIKVEPIKDRMLARFRAAYPLGQEGERMLEQLIEESRRSAPRIPDEQLVNVPDGATRRGYEEALLQEKDTSGWTADDWRGWSELTANSDRTMEWFLRGLNEARVRDELGLPPVPTS